MAGEATARPGGDRMFTAYVTVSEGGEGARGAPPGRRWRAVCGALLVSVALIAATAGLRARSASDELASGAPLGSAAQAEQMGELSALASEAIANARPTFVRGQKLAWLNAGAVPDDNVFDHPVTWKAPDDPARTQAKKGTAEYVTSIHPAGGLEVDHETDNGSPKGDSFGIDRSVDDMFHGSPPSPKPAAPDRIWTMPMGQQFKITDPTDTGVAKTPTFTAFKIDTSVDDFFTHHANPALACFRKVDDQYLKDWFVSKQSYALEEAMTLCSVTKDCGGITKQEGYFGGVGWTLRHGRVPTDVISPSGTIDMDLDLSRSCGPDRNAPCATSQSSTDGEAVSGKAVDGFTGGDFSDGKCAKTAKEENPYWLEDFGRAVRITSLKVYGRSDADTDALEGFRVRVSDKPDVHAPSRMCAKSQPAPTEDTGWITEVTCNPPAEGQYLWVDIPGKDKELALCGVEVTGTELADGPADSYLYICKKPLNQN